jgi:Beta-lactamase enzyme family
LVNDNDAFNRLYEFLGQESINNSLHSMGYDDVQIIHRLDISLSEQQNRKTNPLKFIDKASTVIYEQQPANSDLQYAKRNTRLGKGYIKDKVLVNKPFDFSIKNRLSLEDMHSILRSVIFPEETTGKRKFNLRQDDYTFCINICRCIPGNPNFHIMTALSSTIIM